MSDILERLRGYNPIDRTSDNIRAAKDIADAAAEIERLRGELHTVTDCIDDILYDPKFHPRDEYGYEIRGNEIYLIPHPVQEIHMPALRMWFVQRAEADEAARAAGGGE